MSDSALYSLRHCLIVDWLKEINDSRINQLGQNLTVKTDAGQCQSSKLFSATNMLRQN